MRRHTLVAALVGLCLAVVPAAALGAEDQPAPVPGPELSPAAGPAARQRRSTVGPRSGRSPVAPRWRGEPGPAARAAAGRPARGTPGAPGRGEPVNAGPGGAGAARKRKLEGVKRGRARPVTDPLAPVTDLVRPGYGASSAWAAPRQASMTGEAISARAMMATPDVTVARTTGPGMRRIFRGAPSAGGSHTTVTTRR